MATYWSWTHAGHGHMLEKYLLSRYNVLNKVADMMDTNHPSGQNHKVAADLTGTRQLFLMY